MKISCFEELWKLLPLPVQKTRLQWDYISLLHGSEQMYCIRSCIELAGLEPWVIHLILLKFQPLHSTPVRFSEDHPTDKVPTDRQGNVILYGGGTLFSLGLEPSEIHSSWRHQRGECNTKACWQDIDQTDWNLFPDSYCHMSADHTSSPVNHKVSKLNKV